MRSDLASQVASHDRLPRRNHWCGSIPIPAYLVNHKPAFLSTRPSISLPLHPLQPTVTGSAEERNRSDALRASRRMISTQLGATTPYPCICIYSPQRHHRPTVQPRFWMRLRLYTRLRDMSAIKWTWIIHIVWLYIDTYIIIICNFFYFFLTDMGWNAFCPIKKKHAIMIHTLEAWGK